MIIERVPKHQACNYDEVETGETFMAQSPENGILWIKIDEGDCCVNLATGEISDEFHDKDRVFIIKAKVVWED